MGRVVIPLSDRYGTRVVKRHPGGMLQRMSYSERKRGYKGSQESNNKKFHLTSYRPGKYYKRA